MNKDARFSAEITHIMMLHMFHTTRCESGSTEQEDGSRHGQKIPLAGSFLTHQPVVCDPWCPRIGFGRLRDDFSRKHPVPSRQFQLIRLRRQKNSTSLTQLCINEGSLGRKQRVVINSAALPARIISHCHPAAMRDSHFYQLLQQTR